MTTAQLAASQAGSEVGAGAWFHNPATGELARTNVGPAETAGRRIETDLWLQPGAAVAGAHVHDHVVERFEVLAGEVGLPGRGASSARFAPATGRSRSRPGSRTTGGTPAAASRTSASRSTRGPMPPAAPPLASRR